LEAEDYIHPNHGAHWSRTHFTSLLAKCLRPLSQEMTGRVVTPSGLQIRLISTLHPCPITPDLQTSFSSPVSDSLFPPKPAPLTPVALAPLPAQPLVSVIVPSYNQGRFIGATIDSILGQDYRPIEILVIDGASTDETVEVLKSYGEVPELKWISEPDSGVVQAVNKGFARAAGQIVAIQSSDDCYLPGAVSRMVQEFHKDGRVGLVYGDTVKVDAAGNELLRQRIGPYSLENLFLVKTWIPQPSAFFRRGLLDALGGWDERIPYAPDTDLWIRMAFRTEVRKIDQYLSQRRVHGEQRDTQGAKIIRDYSRMIDQSPDIAAASPELRRAARAGVYLFKIRYNVSGSDWTNAWNRLRAGMIHRDLRDHRAVCRHLLLPARRLLSKIKQRLMLPIRAASPSR
jgi:glycosyltransferase involved in cell wall biosynthesis